MPVLSKPTQNKRVWPVGAEARYGNRRALILDTKPTESGINYHRIKLLDDNLVLPQRISANDLH